jgi:hypothetical protein
LPVETGATMTSQLIALQEQARLANHANDSKFNARQKVCAEDPKLDARQRAENAEAGLNLSEQDRKRVQVALNALGHKILR